MSESEREGKEREGKEKGERERMVSKLTAPVAPLFVLITICCVFGVIHVRWVRGCGCDTWGYLRTTKMNIRRFN